MGVIRKQSTISTIYSYIGVVIGFITSALIMPKVLSTDQIGLLKLIVAITGVFSGVFSLGVHQLLLRSFPKFEGQKEKRNKLFIFSFKTVLVGAIVGIPFYYFFSSDLLNLNVQTTGFDKGLIFVILIYFTIISRLVYRMMFSYFRMFEEITVDSFIQNVFHKFSILTLIVLYVLGGIDYRLFVYSYLVIYLTFPFIMYLLYRVRKETFINNIEWFKFNRKSTNVFTKVERIEFYKLLLFGTLTTIGGSVYLYLDTIMVNSFLGESEVGIYGTMFLFGMIVIIPARSLKNIAVSVLSKSFKSNNIPEIASIYQKSSITLLVIGGYIFMGVWCNLYTVFDFLPEVFQLGRLVVLFIGIGQLFDMMTGVNGEIVAASPHYRLNTYFILITIVVGVVTNYFLIPTFGIDGAGLATMLTIICINGLKLIAVYKLFKIQPFTIKSLIAIATILLVTFIVTAVPNIENSYFNLLFKSILITVFYLPLIYFLRVSEDINSFIDKWVNKIIKKQ